MSEFSRKSFYYKGETLMISSYEEKPVSCFLEGLDRPVYLYNKKSIETRVKAYQKSLESLDAHIHYAVKANSNLEVLSFIRSLKVGADVVSIGEFNQALEAGFKGPDIIFSGVGKTKSEISEALHKNVGQINCESFSEVKRVIEMAKAQSQKAKIGIRINPDIPVETHPYIATGFRENKFGVALSQLHDISKLVLKNKDVVELKGISCHIGSQIMDSAPLVKAAKSVFQIYKELTNFGHHISHLDLGGGLGVDYQSDDEEKDLQNIEDFGLKVSEIFKSYTGKILIEPGRSLVARSGILLSRVEYVKSNGFKDFIILNTGMHHLMRPSLYKAYHKIIPIQKRPGAIKNFDVVGPICESSDVLGYERNLVEPNEGDWLGILDSGAYGMSMASAYNLHQFPKEILV